MGTEPTRFAPACSRIPGIGILLVLVAIVINQGGNVVAKKLSTNSFTMLFYRDMLILSWQAPLVIRVGKSPFPTGSRGLLLLRGISVGLLLAGHFYALRQLPLADVTMVPY